MSKRMGIRAALAAAVASIAAVLVITQAAAQMPTVKVTSATISPGNSGTVELQAISIGTPGLGAWEVGITYNTSVVTALSCSPQNGSVCNADYAPGRVQIAGASGTGLLGTSTLSGITFRCLTEGSSDLSLIVGEFADSTQGNPRPIGPAVNAGRITCSASEGLPTVPTARPHATSTPVPTSTPGVNGLPNTGSGTGSSGSTDWLIAALAALGLVSVVGFGASRLLSQRARRD